MATTLVHLFFVCLKAMKCWELVQLDNTVSTMLIIVNDFMGLLFDLFDRLSVQQQSTASMIFWSLWKRCNTKLWEGASCTFINVPQPLKKIHYLYKKKCMPSVEKSATIITNYLRQQKHSPTITKGIVCPI